MLCGVNSKNKILSAPLPTMLNETCCMWQVSQAPVCVTLIMIIMTSYTAQDITMRALHASCCCFSGGFFSSSLHNDKHSLAHIYTLNILTISKTGIKPITNYHNQVLIQAWHKLYLIIVWLPIMTISLNQVLSSAGCDLSNVLSRGRRGIHMQSSEK